MCQPTENQDTKSSLIFAIANYVINNLLTDTGVYNQFKDKTNDRNKE